MLTKNKRKSTLVWGDSFFSGLRIIPSPRLDKLAKQFIKPNPRPRNVRKG
jgi:hypothetical protein